MRQPFATLFAGWEDHWLLGRYLTGDVPDWDGIMADPQIDALSSGEVTLLWAGLALANKDRTLSLAEVAHNLDRPNRMRVATALCQGS